MAHLEPIRIAITGPESSGKTTLTMALAAYFAVPWVREMAREHLAGTNGAYREDDLLRIARAQLQEEEHVSRQLEEPAPLLLCDTDMITIRIWSQEKYGQVVPEMEALVRSTHYDLCLLCRPDIPWEPDPLRENPRDRDRLYTRYEETLRELQRPYMVVEGKHEQRVSMALASIEVLRSARSVG